MFLEEKIKKKVLFRNTQIIRRMGGTASKNGSAVCRLWTNINHSSFTYPEQVEFPEISQKPSFGIALSGGGCRALSMSIGTLRGLHQIGYLEKARYISTNSGSSWLSGPLCYSSGNIQTFLGTYLPPQQCSLKALKQIDIQSHTFLVCQGKNLETFLTKFRSHYSGNDADPRGFWSEAVGQIFFQPYQLNAYDHLPVVKGANQTMIHKNTNHPMNKMTACDLTRTPFPIISGTLVVRGKEMTAPLEFTPLYYGVPGSSRGHDNGKTFPVGGYLIEPFGFTSNPTKEQSETIQKLLQNQPNSPACHRVEVKSPSTIISVSDQAGISSSAVSEVAAHLISTNLSKELDFSVYPIWNPLTGDTNPMTLADGLGGDNTAIHPLLRRKVRKICSMFAINLSIMSPVDHRNMSQSGFADVAALFGVMTCDGKTIDGVTAEDYNKYRQVFPSEDFEKLLNGLKEKYVEGKPCTFILRTRALPNPHIGIPGDHPVDLLMVLCAPTDDWVNSLPDGTRKKVLKSRKEIDQLLNKQPTSIENGHRQEEEEEKNDEGLIDRVEDVMKNWNEKFHHSADEVRRTLREALGTSKLKDFPFIRTESFDYTAQLVNLITNLMCWEVVESKSLFEELLKDEE